jgi:hypothetical protein
MKVKIAVSSDPGVPMDGKLVSHGELSGPPLTFGFFSSEVNRGWVGGDLEGKEEGKADRTRTVFG